MKRTFKSGAQKWHSKQNIPELNAKLPQITRLFRPAGEGCTHLPEETGIVLFAIANMTVLYHVANGTALSVLC